MEMVGEHDTAGVLSKLGETVLQRHGLRYTHEQLVDRIHCQLHH